VDAATALSESMSSVEDDSTKKRYSALFHRLDEVATIDQGFTQFQEFMFGRLLKVEYWCSDKLKRKRNPRAQAFGICSWLKHEYFIPGLSMKHLSLA
jgi:hypothetical protein